MFESFDQLRSFVRTSRTVLLTGPEGPDGDSLGACLALRRVLASAEPAARVVVTGVVPPRYRFLPGAEASVGDDALPEADGVVVLDGDRRRLLPGVLERFNAARWTALVDHHRSTDPEPYTLAVFDPQAESTCGLVWAMAKHWAVPVDAELAVALYTGLIFDTGGFRYSNTQASTHRLAASLLETGFDHAAVSLRVLAERRPAGFRLLAELLRAARFEEDGRLALVSCPRALFSATGADESDLEGVVDHLQHTEGVRLAAVLVEKRGGRVKVSLRSRGEVDVAALASALHEGGGGHAKAAGVMLEGTLDDVGAWVGARLAAAVRAVP